MRWSVAIALLLFFAAPSSGQTSSRFDAGVVARADRIFIQDGAGGGVPVIGVSGRGWFTEHYAVEAELTLASRLLTRSYEGQFISYAPGPAVSHEDFVRFAPTARRTLGYDAGAGGSAAFVMRWRSGSRVSPSARFGVAWRRYVETSSYEILSIPDGVDPARVARDFAPEEQSLTRGGYLFGIDVPVAISARLSLSPEFRFVWAPLAIDGAQRELGLGARMTWKF